MDRQQGDCLASPFTRLLTGISVRTQASRMAKKYEEKGGDYENVRFRQHALPCDCSRARVDAGSGVEE